MTGCQTVKTRACFSERAEVLLLFRGRGWWRSMVCIGVLVKSEIWKADREARKASARGNWISCKRQGLLVIGTGVND